MQLINAIKGPQALVQGTMPVNEGVTTLAVAATLALGEMNLAKLDSISGLFKLSSPVASLVNFDVNPIDDLGVTRNDSLAGGAAFARIRQFTLNAGQADTIFWTINRNGQGYYSQGLVAAVSGVIPFQFGRVPGLSFVLTNDAASPVGNVTIQMARIYAG